MKRTLLGMTVAGSLLLAGCGESGEDEADAPTGSTSPSSAGSAGKVEFAAVPFSTDGRDRLSAIALGADGKTYAAGFTTVGDDQQVAVMRLGTDGKLDTSYGQGGIATVNVSKGKTAEQARGIVVGDDGKAVVSGTAEHDVTATGDAAKDTDVVAVRFDKDGKPDSTFGTNGVARLDVGAGRAVDEKTFVGDSGYGITALPSGGYAVFGQTSAGTDRKDADYALVGVTAAGALDTAFGTNGVTKVDLDSSGDSARNVVVDGDKILATGYSHGEDGVVRPMLLRTSLTGTPDATFGKSGVASHTVLASVTESYMVRPQGDSYILAGYGKDAEADKVDLVAYRFTGTGELDKTFGTGGVTRIDNAKEDDRARNLEVLSDGRILAVGSGKLNAEKVQAMVVLLSKDGAPVTSFGQNGRILSDFGGVGDSWYGVAVSKDGRTAHLAGFLGVAADSKTDDDDAVVGTLTLS